MDELHRKIEDKDKDIKKAKADAIGYIKELNKDCEARFKNSDIKKLSKDFGDLNGAMEDLLKAGQGNSENDKLREELSEARCEIKNLKGKVAAMKKKGCPDCGSKDDKDGKDGKGGKGKGAKEGGYDDVPGEGGCPIDTTKLRMRARYALGELHAREQEHCAACRNRLTCCGQGPACPCGASNPCGGEALSMKCEGCGPCGKDKPDASCAKKDCNTGDSCK